MSDKSDKIHELLRQRGEQSLPDGYLDNFLKDFQSRQRSELLNHSARGLFFERLSTYFSGFGAPRWAGAAAGACAAAVLGIFLIQAGSSVPEESTNIPLAVHEDPISPTELAEQRSHVEFISPVSFQFSEDLHPTRSSRTISDHFLVEAEGPLSDLYILPPSRYAPDSHNSYFRQF